MAIVCGFFGPNYTRRLSFDVRACGGGKHTHSSFSVLFSTRQRSLFALVDTPRLPISPVAFAENFFANVTLQEDQVHGLA